jgi:hypothetical protein
VIVVLSAIAVAGGLLVGRLVASRHKALPARQPSERPPTPEEIALDEELSGAPPVELAEPVDWSVFPCALGDVVVRTIDGAEAWLAGAIVLREDAPAAVLFIAPDAAGERALYARARPSSELSWVAPVPPGALVVGTEPPSAIELAGTRFERARRLPLRADRAGTGAPDLGGIAIVGEYTAASGEVAIVILADGVSRAWRGRRLGEGEYEVWSVERARADGKPRAITPK